MRHRREGKYSSEFRDALNEPSGWLVSWGIIAIIALLLMVFLGSFLYKYPDTINTSVTITTVNPPISMVGKVNGKIDKIFVSDGQEVKSKDILVLIENTASFKDVQQLKGDLEHLKDWLLGGRILPDVKMNRNLSLGPVQDPYSALLEDYDLYCLHTNRMYFSEKRSSKRKQIMLYEGYRRNMAAQNVVLKRELDLTQKRFLRDSTLHIDKVISDDDFDNARITYLQKLYVFQVAEANLYDVTIKIEELQEGVLGLEENESVQVGNLRSSIQKKLNVLLATLAAWEESYVIKSPIDGRVSLSKFYASGLNTTVGETIVSVIPKDSTVLVARAETSMTNAGKLEPGLKVNIKLENYPYLEYGMLKGTVKHVSTLSENKTYYVNIALDNGLKTTLRKNLQFSQRMSGTAEIITKNRRLIERITEPILALFRK